MLRERRVIIIVFLIFFIGFSLNFYKNNREIPLDKANENKDLEKEFTKQNLAAVNPEHEVIGIIPDKSGKIFSNISVSNLNCYINRYEPNLDNQPELFLQGWNLTHAKMLFENIYALNYTKDIETDPTEVIMSSSETDPIYVYQKFSVQTDQYINNVSIFIQDIIDADTYTDENSWEVSIVNCSNDPLGTPNPNTTLGTLKKPHPNNIIAHWELFDFKNSKNGSIFLNTSKTKSTNIDGIDKYWYAIKIKIPPNDTQYGGGEKFLYLNPDGPDPNEIGEGETFAISPQFSNHSFFIENVLENKTILGENLKGNISSFTNFDENRFITKSNESSYIDYISVTVRFELDNLTISDYTWEELKTIDIDDPILNNYFFNISLVLNVNDSDGLRNTQLDLYNPDEGGYDTMTHDMILDSEEEYLQNYIVTIPTEKLFIIQHINTSLNGNNSLIFRFYYDNYLGYYDYELSINLFKLEVEEIETIDTIRKYDPVIHNLHYCNNITSLNGSISTPNNDILDSIKANDDKFLNVLGDSGSNTTSIEFKFNILTNLNSSLWDVDDPTDWILNLPNPIIPQIDFHISLNVSIQDSSDLALAALEIYNGGNFSQFAGIEWRQFLDNKTFADKDENTKVLQLGSSYTWYMMHLINESDDNSLLVRLRFIGSGGLKGINVSIDEFTLNFHIQNAISSDIVSRIGFGLNTKLIKPSIIHLENWGSLISDDGVWEVDIDNGVPIQFVYSFNVTSIWPEVFFDVSGIYTIEKSQDYEWQYYLQSNNTKVLWNVSTDISYYSYDNYNNIKESMSLQFEVPSDWLLMEIYNSSASPPTFIGGWSPTIFSNNQFKTITISNISDGIWIVRMNSSISSMYIDYSATGEIKIDQIIGLNVSISNHFGGTINFKVYNESSSLVFNTYNVLNRTALENSTIFEWNIFETIQTPGTYHLKTYWVLYNQSHAFVSLKIKEIIISKLQVSIEFVEEPTYYMNEESLYHAVNVIDENSNPLTDAEIIFEVFDESNQIKFSTSSITDDNGIAVAFLKFNDIGDNFTIKATYEGQGIFDNSEFIYTRDKVKVNLVIIEEPDFLKKEDEYCYAFNVTDDNNNPLENINIIFEVLDEVGRIVFNKSAISDSTGYGIVFLEFNDITSNFTIRAKHISESVFADSAFILERSRINLNILFVDQPRTQYRVRTTEHFTVRVTNNNENPIENLEIIFELLDSTGQVINDTLATTNEQGIVSGELNFQKTGSRCSIRVRTDEEGIFTGNVITESTIKVVDDFTLIIERFMDFLLYIIISLASVSIIIAMGYIKKSKLRKIWAENAATLDDLARIAHIMIIHKDGGIPIFNRQISLIDINPSLISGFLQAISAFRSEIKMEKETDIKDQGFEMDYYDFKIIITDGEYIRVALIIHGIPTQTLKENQKLFTSKFENRFKLKLTDFEGEIAPFRSADNLLEEHFNISLVFPLKLGVLSKVIKVKGLEKALIKIAEEIQKEKNFFLVRKLLSFALAGRKESREKIINAILSIKEKGLIIRADL